MAWVIGLLILLAGIGFVIWKLRKAVGSAVESDQQITAVVDELAREPDVLLEEAARSSPEVFDNWLREQIAERLSDANAIEEAFREILDKVAQKLCLHCVDTWTASNDTEGATTLFAVHDFMRDYDLAETVANSGAYEHLSSGQRSALEGMPESDRLTGSMRMRAHEWLGVDQDVVQRIGQIELPVPADIYGCVTRRR